MFIDRILAPIETLGPGMRLVIWVKGCSKRCKGCANPELWDIDKSREFNVKDVSRIIANIYKETPFDGVTITGGDPLEQKKELFDLLMDLNKYTEDILVYTGYTIEELNDVLSEDEMKTLTSQIAVLIEGRYIDELNTKDVVLRGSSNQKILYFKRKFIEPYEKYLQQGRKIQNVYMGNQLISVGIHDRKEQ